MTETDGLPPRQRAMVMSAILMGSMLTNLDGAIANIALPTIARDLGVGDAATVWVVNGYQLSLAICLLPAAALGSIWGNRIVFAIGLTLFILSSLGCALSPNIGTLVTARLVQGIGGAAVASVGPGMIREIYPRRILGRGMALIAMVVAVSGAAGPTIASLLLAVAHWPWLFLINLPVGLIALPLFLSTAPPGYRTARPFDVGGALLNAIALGGIVTGIGTIGGERPAFGAIELVVGVLALGALVMQQRRTALLLPVDLMRIPIFALSFCTSVCSYCAQILAYVSLPFMFETVLHRSQTVTGFLVTPWPAAVALAALAAGRLSARYPVTTLGSIGMSVLALGLVLLVALPAAPSNIDIVWRMAVCGIGFGFFQTPNNIAILTAAPVERAGAASAMLAVARTGGWSLGSALVTLLFDAFGARGTTVCLETAAGFAAVGAVFGGIRFYEARQTAR